MIDTKFLQVQESTVLRLIVIAELFAMQDGIEEDSRPLLLLALASAELFAGAPELDKEQYRAALCDLASKYSLLGATFVEELSKQVDGADRDDSATIATAQRVN